MPVTSFYIGKCRYNGPRCRFELTPNNSKLIETTVPGCGRPRALVWLRVADTEDEWLASREETIGPFKEEEEE